MKEFKQVEVEMLENQKGQDVGESGTAFEVREYVSGQIYKLGADLGNAFIEKKWAKEVAKGKKGEPKLDMGQKKGAPENKAASSAPENKKGGKK